MNSENNSLSYFGTFMNQEHISIRPTRRRELANDWVVVFKESK